VRTSVEDVATWAGVVTGQEALFHALRSLPCPVTVETLFLTVTDGIPGAMNTFLAPGQVATKEAAEAITLQDCLALLTADAVIIADSFGVVAKHIVEKWLTGRFSKEGFRSAMLTVLTVHRTARQKQTPTFRLIMTGAFTLFLIRVGIAHTSGRLYQNSLML
jgi:hypothetical protein